MFSSVTSYFFVVVCRDSANKRARDVRIATKTNHGTCFYFRAYFFAKSCFVFCFVSSWYVLRLSLLSRHVFFLCLLRERGHEQWITQKTCIYDWLAFFGDHLEWLTARTNEACMRFSFVLAVTNRDLQHTKLRIMTGLHFVDAIWKGWPPERMKLVTRFSLVLAVMHIDLQHKKTRIYDWLAFSGDHL